MVVLPLDTLSIYTLDNVHHQGLVCGLRQIVLGTEEKQQICFLLNRLLLDQRRVVPVC